MSPAKSYGLEHIDKANLYSFNQQLHLCMSRCHNQLVFADSWYYKYQEDMPYIAQVKLAITTNT
jgi:hypothetical protein